jgi:hypothetical protein
MKAVIISDDPAFASYATSTLARVGRQAGVNVHWATKSWPINALNEPALAEKALVEASDAHVILFPADQTHSLPDWIFNWLARWAATRTIQDAAVGVISDEKNAGLATLTFPELSKFVRVHGLSLIVNDEPTANDSATLPDRFPPELALTLPFAETPLAVPATRGCYRSFGINE